jgi:hypothetical protein
VGLESRCAGDLGNIINANIPPAVFDLTKIGLAYARDLQHVALG